MVWKTMDVERTMEFILRMQAKAEARMAKFDKRMEAIRKLVQTGMKMLVKIDQNLLALTEAQRKTDRKFDRLIDSWTKRRTNGHQTKD